MASAPPPRVLAAAAVLALRRAGRLPAQTQAIDLVPHRAVYELSLGKVRGKAVGAERARAHPLRFLRQRLRGLHAGVPAGRGARQRRGQDQPQRSALDHLGGRRRQDYRFASQNHLNQKLLDAVDGKAERSTGGVAVTLTKPERSKVDLDAAIVFPTEHVRRIIEAAREGQTILEFPIYDGSETGEKVYNSLTVIGREIGPGEREPTTPPPATRCWPACGAGR